jgi:cytochrome b subunit of formate dehydrogenase
MRETTEHRNQSQSTKMTHVLHPYNQVAFFHEVIKILLLLRLNLFPKVDNHTFLFFQDLFGKTDFGHL